MATKKNINEMSFLDHLEDLRWHLIRAVLGILVVATLAFIFKDIVVGIIMAPKDMSFPTYAGLCKIAQLISIDTSFCAGELPFEIEVRQVAGQFSAHIWTSIYTGFVVGFPYVLYQLWSFISPGLNPGEQKNSRGFIIVSTLLFFTGVLFGYYVITPLSLNFLANYSFTDQISNAWDLKSYISLVRSSALASGLVFELPIVIYFLTKIGLVTPQILRKYRKFALVIVLILSAIITPPDIASQVIVAIPILILYQVSIYISAVITKREKQNT